MTITKIFNNKFQIIDYAKRPFKEAKEFIICSLVFEI
jgi:hypothetical protein